jgi:hypothetical protein
LRREAFGELIQIDGSEHRWFEDRGAPCSLLVFIDDATGILLGPRCRSAVCISKTDRISRPSSMPAAIR